MHSLLMGGSAFASLDYIMCIMVRQSLKPVKKSNKFYKELPIISSILEDTLAGLRALLESYIQPCGGTSIKEWRDLIL
jgi:hypothetical protein